MRQTEVRRTAAEKDIEHHAVGERSGSAGGQKAGESRTRRAVASSAGAIAESAWVEGEPRETGARERPDVVEREGFQVLDAGPVAVGIQRVVDRQLQLPSAQIGRAECNVLKCQ